MAKVTLKNICKIYDGVVKAVNDFNLEVKDSEFIVFTGPSGSGKSTILRMIAGLEEITRGELYIGNILSNNIPPRDRDIAIVLQNYALYPHMTVFDNIAFGLKLRKIAKEEIQKRVIEAAKVLDISDLLNMKPKELAANQRQQVALGRAIAREPKVLLLDEPLLNLNAKLRSQMRTEILNLHKKLSATFIYVTHDQIEAMEMGERIVVMKDGITQQIGSPQNLYENPCNDFVAGFIGTPPMNFIDAILIKENDKYMLLFSDYKIELPPEKSKNNVLEAYINKPVIFGIRPEFLSLDINDNLNKSLADFKAEVELTELIGEKTYLYLDVNKNSIIMNVSPDTTAKSGDLLDIYINTENIHIFDKSDGKTIVN